MEWLILALSVIGAYLLGSISSAILVCFVLRLGDPRTQGSGNPGATNVLRIGGKFAAALTLLGDIAKGLVPVILVKQWTNNPFIISAVLLAAVIGHLYPVFFKFKGGKGVATALGGLLGLSLSLGGIFIFTWIGIFALCRYSSLSALIAIVSMPFWAWGFLDERYAPTLGVLAVIILWRHRDNMHRLLTGKENKTSFKRAPKS
jgi:glycerol-3-phosphate acyltransferase PlsY